MTLMRTDEAQLVLRGATSEVSADASSVVVRADLGVSNLNGNPIMGLSAADFMVPESDCTNFVPACILEPSGAEFSAGYWYPSQRSPVQVTLSGTGPPAHYKVQYVPEAPPGMFTAGRTLITYVDVRVGADTVRSVRVDVPL